MTHLLAGPRLCPSTTLKLRGVVVPVVTPLTPDHQVDQASLRQLVRHLLRNGVHGLSALGSIGEALFLDARQRAVALETIADENAARLPLMAGVIDATTERVIAQARIARALGVQALVVTAPFGMLTSQAETMDHFRRIRDAVDLPIVACDLPACVHLKLTRATLRSLQEEGVMAALQDDSGDDANLRLVMRDFADQPDFPVLTGSETTADYALLGGAHGCVPGLANVDPAGYVRLHDATQAGDWPRARQEQERLIRLHQIVGQGVPVTSPNASGVGGYKAALQLLGLIAHRHMSPPNRLVPEGGRERIRDLLQAAGLLGDRASCRPALRPSPLPFLSPERSELFP